MRKQSLIALIFVFFITQVANANLSEFLDYQEIKTKTREAISELDIKFSGSLADIDLIEGVSLASKYRYEVDASYLDQHYIRIDKYDLKSDINVGDLVKDLVDLPFSFSVNRQNSFLFVRQFKTKSEARKAAPYSPERLPISAEKALNDLEKGDFVAIPANLNVAISLAADTSFVAPVIISASAGVHAVISGEFTIQVFKIDDQHVRLKLISKRSYGKNADAGVGLKFNFFGIRVLDKAIERQFEKELVQLNYGISPNAQFMVDYVFDLSNKRARQAYDSILKSTVKFKDISIINNIGAGKELKNRLLSTFEQADKIFEEDKNIEPKNRRISRIFKGFSDNELENKRLKLAFLFASFTKENAYSESKLSMIDKNENNRDFFYPSYSRFKETKFGKFVFDFKDQMYQNNFGLIPRTKSEDGKKKNPDFGMTFEKNDKYLLESEQKVIAKFLMGLVPRSLEQKLGLSEWRSNEKKIDSKIFFQLVIKADAFNHLKLLEKDFIQQSLITFVEDKKNLKLIANADDALEKIKDFLFVSRFITKESLLKLGEEIHTILQDKEQNSENMTAQLVRLNQEGIFSRIGIGFLISMLPEEKLNEMVYLKIVMNAKELKPITNEFGTLNNRALYKELTEIQSRITNQSYDLRVSLDDQNREENEVIEN